HRVPEAVGGWRGAGNRMEGVLSRVRSREARRSRATRRGALELPEAEAVSFLQGQRDELREICGVGPIVRGRASDPHGGASLRCGLGRKSEAARGARGGARGGPAERGGPRAAGGRRREEA